MAYNIEAIATCCKFVATVTGGIVAGGAFYITAIEHPGWMGADMITAVKAWKQTFNRANNIQPLISIFTTAAAIVTFVVDWGTPKPSIGWLVATICYLLVTPWTLFVMMPTNKELLETDKCIEKGEIWIREKLILWGKMHAARTVLEVSALAIMVYTICYGPK